MIADLHKTLIEPNLVFDTAPPVADIERALEERIQSKGSISVMYGETYDRFGPTLDSLKYYFMVAAVARGLRALGARVTPTILVADVATCRNEPEERHDEIMTAGRARVAFVRAISDLYSLRLNVLAMSEYLHGERFQETLQAIRNASSRDAEVFHWVRQTVPSSKVAIEEDKGFAYAFEEIATIINYDLKVGPPREKFYDEPARLIARRLGYEQLMSVYLRPTFPLGVGPALYLSDPEIEEYGVTPYKAGSKGLQDHRIILGRTSSARMLELINTSFVSKNRALPNPVLDLAVIAEIARQYLNQDFQDATFGDSFYRGELSSKQLRDRAGELATLHVLEPVQLLNQEALAS
jgi:hypothetical protein